jgi:hypothetical protein
MPTCTFGLTAASRASILDVLRAPGGAITMRKGGTMRGTCTALAILLIAGLEAGAADCNWNGVEDRLEIASGSQPDCNGNDIPDPCDILPVNYGLAAREGPNVESPIRSAAAADLDGDGNPDLAVCSWPFQAVAILWHEGRGSFSKPEPIRIEKPILGIAAGDLDGDMLQDLVITTQAGISFFLNDGSRRFRAAAIDIDTASWPIADPVVSDLDVDGDADLAAVGQSGAFVLLNRGGGVFATPPISIPIGSSPVALAAVGLDGDADIDLVTVNDAGSQAPVDNVSVLLNGGGGTFGPPRNFSVEEGARSIAAGDLDGDGNADAVAACSASGVLDVLFGAGDGSFARSQDVLLDGPPSFASLGDVDQDGDLDLASCRVGFRGLGFVGVQLNHGDGTLASPVEFLSLFSSDRLLITDVTGEGGLEIVAVLSSGTSLLVLERIAAARDGDCDASGVPDLCELEGNDCNRNRILDTCDIALGASADCDRNRVPDECDPDCNANGVPDVCDLAAGTSPDCNQNALPDECDLGPLVRFESAWVELSGKEIQELRTADLDGDGRADIFGARPEAQTVAVLWGEMQGDFTPPVDFRLGTGNRYVFVEAGDLDGDVDLDLVAIEDGRRTMTLTQEGRSFSVARLEGGVSPRALALGDLEGDGDLDIAVVNNGQVAFFGNDGKGRFSLLPETGVHFMSSFLFLPDLNGDGRAELVGRSAGTEFLRVLWNEDGRLEASTDIPIRPRSPSLPVWTSTATATSTSRPSPMGSRSPSRRAREGSRRSRWRPWPRTSMRSARVTWMEMGMWTSSSVWMERESSSS